MRNTRPARWGCCQIFQPTRKEINFSCCLNYWLKKKVYRQELNPGLSYATLSPTPLHYQADPSSNWKIKPYHANKRENNNNKKIGHQSIFISLFSLFPLLFLFHYNINHLLPFLMSRNLFKDYSARLFVYNISFLAAQNSTANPICSFFFIKVK